MQCSIKLHTAKDTEKRYCMLGFMEWETGDNIYYQRGIGHCANIERTDERHVRHVRVLVLRRTRQAVSPLRKYPSRRGQPSLNTNGGLRVGESHDDVQSTNGTGSSRMIHLQAPNTTGVSTATWKDHTRHQGPSVAGKTTTSGH